MGVEAENVFARKFEESPRRLGHQHRASVPGEEQNAVLQIAENLVEIFSQRGEDLFHITHALADPLNLGGNLRGRILPGARPSAALRRLAGRGQAVELAADPFHWLQREIA